MMKQGNYTFKLTQESVDSFNHKYSFGGKAILFENINGALNDHVYNEYRAIQKQILKQILYLNNLDYDSKKLEINGSLTYEDEDVHIEFYSWYSEIEVYFKKNNLTRSAYTHEVYAENEINLYFN